MDGRGPLCPLVALARCSPVGDPLEASVKELILLEWGGDTVLCHASDESECGNFLGEVHTALVLDVESISFALGDAGKEIIKCVILKSDIVGSDLCVANSDIVDCRVNNKVVERGIHVGLDVEVKLEGSLWSSGGSIGAENCKVGIESAFREVSNHDSVLCVHLNSFSVFLHNVEIEHHLEVAAIVVIELVEDLHELGLEVSISLYSDILAVQLEKGRV